MNVFILYYPRHPDVDMTMYVYIHTYLQCYHFILILYIMQPAITQSAVSINNVLSECDDSNYEGAIVIQGLSSSNLNCTVLALYSHERLSLS